MKEEVRPWLILTWLQIFNNKTIVLALDKELKAASRLPFIITFFSFFCLCILRCLFLLVLSFCLFLWHKVTALYIKLLANLSYRCRLISLLVRWSDLLGRESIPIDWCHILCCLLLDHLLLKLLLLCNTLNILFKLVVQI